MAQKLKGPLISSRLVLINKFPHNGKKTKIKNKSARMFPSLHVLKSLTLKRVIIEKYLSFRLQLQIVVFNSNSQIELKLEYEKRKQQFFIFSWWNFGSQL